MSEIWKSINLQSYKGKSPIHNIEVFKLQRSQKFQKMVQVSKSKYVTQIFDSNWHMKRIKKKLQLKNIPKPNIHKTPSLKIKKLFSQHVERLREFTLNLCAYKSCALFKILFILSESHRKSAKRRTVPKIVEHSWSP